MAVKTSKKVSSNVSKKAGTGAETQETDAHEGTVAGETLVSTQHAKVRYSGGATINLGDYNSGRVDVTIEYPCEVDEIDETYEMCKEWVDTRLQAEVDEMTGGDDE